MKSHKIASIVVFVAIVAFFAGSPAARAQMTAVDGCMQDIAGFALQCTANDVKISGVALKPNGDPDITITDPCAYPGDMVTFTARFEVLLTAQERYDIGIYFATDGDPNNDGAISGTCSISSLAYAPDPPWLDLDHMTRGLCSNNSQIECTSNKDCGRGGICNFTQDLCGDIDANHNPLYPVITITAVCVDDDGDGFLNLPNCTSWRQPGSDRLCLDPLDAFPGAPSKCRCDIGFNVPVPVPKATITVTKTASPTSVNEPGANVIFSVLIKNDGVDPLNIVHIETLTDDVYGNLLDGSNPKVPAATNTCLNLDKDIGAGETVSCQFVAKVEGQGNTSQTDVVTASGVDSRTPPNEVSDDDDATVSIIDVMPAISVTKTANPTSIVEPGGLVTFTVIVSNTSPADALVITSLTDDKHGNLDGQGTCSLAGPLTIAKGGSYTCTFTANVTGNSGYSETDTVTVTGQDEEGNSVSAYASATVSLTNALAQIRLAKTANPTSVNEPGGNVTYSFTVYNDSSVDAVIINSLTDTVYGDLTAATGSTCTVPQTIAAKGSYSCQITEYVAGDPGAGEGQGYDYVMNVATAAGVDDDGYPVSASDDANVNIVNVPPAAHLTKTVTQVEVTYTVTVCNDSTVEALSLDSLVDDQFGNLNGKGDCSAPQTIAVGDCYSCSFTEVVPTSPHTDTVTGTVSDNEGGSVTPPPSGSATVSFSPVTPP